MRNVAASSVSAVLVILGAVFPSRADPRELRVLVWNRGSQSGWVEVEVRAPVWVQWRAPGGPAWPCGRQPEHYGFCETYDLGDAGWREVVVGESVGTWSARAALMLDGTEEEIGIDVHGETLEVELARRASALRLEEDPDGGTELVNQGSAVVRVETLSGAVQGKVERWSGPQGIWLPIAPGTICSVGLSVGTLGPGDRVPVLTYTPVTPGRYRTVLRSEPEELRRDGDVRVTTSYRIVREFSVP